MRLTSQHIIDFKAAYDTIIRNEIYVGMSELTFRIKFIRLTKATLTIVTCCVKIQNDCSESFGTRQELRQGDALSTLVFYVVLEVIVRRANLQTTGTIYNKETQLLAYADDIDIVGRSVRSENEDSALVRPFLISMPKSIYRDRLPWTDPVKTLITHRLGRHLLSVRGIIITLFLFFQNSPVLECHRTLTHLGGHQTNPNTAETPLL
jgi:hypothetical protein